MGINRFLDSLVPVAQPQELAVWEAQCLNLEAQESGRPIVELAFELMAKVAWRMSERILLVRRPKFRSAVVLCGPGSNGGDGFVCAVGLRRAGVRVLAIEVAATHGEVDATSPRELARAGYLDDGGELVTFTEVQPLPENVLRQLEECEVIVDSLLGLQQRVGEHQVLTLRGDIGSLCKVVRGISGSPYRVALDVPTGVDGSCGVVATWVLAADLTLTVGYIKSGLLQHPACQVCGAVEVIPLDVPPIPDPKVFQLNSSILRQLPAVQAAAHKGMFGVVCVVGGVPEYEGASVLACHGAQRAGAGMVTLTWAGKDRPAALWPEVMLSFREASVTQSLLPEKNLNERSVVVVGPGFGVRPEYLPSIFDLIATTRDRNATLILDADVLTILAQSERRELGSHVIITPHPGEAGSLLGISANEVNNDRYAAARRLSSSTGAIVVLKGASTIVDDGSISLVNSSGNVALATPGSGDVLAGIIAALVARGVSRFEASALGVYAHGMAGEAASSSAGANNFTPIRASDCLDHIPKLLPHRVD